MSENINPEEIRKDFSDVESQVVDTVPAVEAPVAEPAQAEETPAPEQEANLADKSLAELSELFEKLKASAERMSRSKEAEAIKSAFYKLLGRLKGESGVSEEAESSQDNPFEAVEQNFKAMYADYKKERAEFNRQQDAQREENLAKKQAIIAELKAIVEGQEDVSAQFPAFRELQNRWKEAGPVPATAFRDLNDTYQFYVEKFYDMVKINRDLRDLDFRKNLEAKQAFCEAAEKLADNENVVSAFHELQKLHEQWKEYGPVAKEFRDDIWNRFKAATAVVNKRYQAHFEGLKEQQAENLVKKTELCERTEAVAAREIKNTADWNAASKEIEEIQAAWRRIGYATKKDNQKIYDRFRAACDAFYTRKREFYSGIKDSMNVITVEGSLEFAKDGDDWKISKITALEELMEFSGEWPNLETKQWPTMPTEETDPTDEPAFPTGTQFADSYQKAIAAYMKVLEDNKKMIEGVQYEYKFDPVGIYDINGDGIPELYFVAATNEEFYSCNLYVYNYNEYAGEALKQIEVESVQYMAASGGFFLIFRP